ncbi:MAG: cyclic nucleotide-binding domain-containing protein [Gammaproteobacteria bacterium]|nr:cyclic nucleotide-binding domain-containing protein [Gammaproteobacteria bacterium]
MSSNAFKFLRPGEFEQLAQSAGVKQYQSDDVLLKEGEKPTGIIIIQKGTVKVSREHMGFNIELAQHGEGEIFGEMSFIEAEPANTSVIAVGNVEALFVTHDQVKAIIRENPGFYGRFYQSLAYILSQRLRDTTGQVTSLGGDDWKSDS